MSSAVDVQTKRENRAKARDLVIPKPKNIRRRRRLEKDTPAWLSFYLHTIFNEEWTPTRLEIINETERVLTDGGFQSLAAYRGCGKTSIFEGVAFKKVLEGVMDFLLLIASSGPIAKNSLASIKGFVEELEHTELHEDYPEVCLPILALEGAPQRASTQTANGKRTQISWSNDRLIFPTVDKSRCSGFVIMARGIDATMKNIKVKGKRPKGVLIDDPDDSDESSEQTKKKRDKIVGDISGLGGKRSKIGVMMLNNTPSRESLGWTFNQPKLYPAWNGRIYPFVPKLPKNSELWEEFVRIRRVDMAELAAVETDEVLIARKADDFLIEHWDEMHDGAVIDDESAFDASDAVDGRPVELSALHKFYCNVADKGWESVLIQDQCAPPEEEEDDNPQPDPEVFRSKVSDFDRGELPDWADFITFGCDLGMYNFHWTVIASEKSGFRSQIMDYGEYLVCNTPNTKQKTKEDQVYAALDWFRADVLNRTYFDKPFDLAYIDAGWWSSVLYPWIRAQNEPRIRACMGSGDRNVGSEFKNYKEFKKKNTKEVKAGWNQRTSVRPGGIRLQWLDSDFWKRFIRDRFSTPTDEVSGSLRLFRTDRDEFGDHAAISRHLSNEWYDLEKRKWVAKSQNHWSDSVYYAMAAAGYLGCRVIEDKTPTRKRIKLSEKVKSNKRRFGKSK